MNVREILTGNILPFWMEKMPDERGGFLGRIGADGSADLDAPKGAILNGRMLWAFAAAYRVLADEKYLGFAERSYDWLSGHLVDRTYGGVHWSCDCLGRPLETKKQTYAIGFAIYGISEYVRALQLAGKAYDEPLELAISLFRDLEKHARDHRHGGYFEAFNRDWSPLGDMRLSERDMNCSKTMNTHLHVIEPYTNLYRVWPDEDLKAAIAHLLDVFADKIIVGEFCDAAGKKHLEGHAGLFFTDDWTRIDRQLSYGHEIEAWWLLEDSMKEIGYRRDFTTLKQRCLDFFENEFSASEGLPYEIREDGSLDADRHWWVQAEAVVGYAKMAIDGQARAGVWSKAVLQFIVDHLLREDGEWLWSVRPDGRGWAPNKTDDVAGFWKCPYHNIRMCVEILAMPQLNM